MPGAGLAALEHNPLRAGSCPAILPFQNHQGGKDEFLGGQEAVCSRIQVQQLATSVYTPGLLRSPQPKPQLTMPRRMSCSSSASPSHTTGPPKSLWVEDTRLSALGLGSAPDGVGVGRDGGPRAHWHASVPPSEKPAQSMPEAKAEQCICWAEQLSRGVRGTCTSHRELKYSSAPANQEHFHPTRPDSASRLDRGTG